jgi:hypothetical protein
MNSWYTIRAQSTGAEVVTHLEVRHAPRGLAGQISARS